MRMIANSLKNFFKCLPYIFVPLGCIFLGFLFGVEMLLNALSEQAAYMEQELSSLLDMTDASFDRLTGFVIAAARELDWSNPISTVSSLFDGVWLTDKIAEFLELSTEQTAALQEKVTVLAAQVAMALIVDLLGLVICVVIGVIAGYFVTNYFVRKSTVQRGFLGFWIAAIADAVLTATLIAFVTWLLMVSKAGAVATAIVGVLVFGLVSLFEAYLLHGRGKIPFRKVVNFGNCIAVYFSQLAVFAAAAAVSALIMWLTASLVSVALVFAVVTVALLVINVNAESYVDGLVRGASVADRRIKTFANLESVPAFLRKEHALEETVLDRAEKSGGNV